MRPFGCPVTILNTLDPLGTFDGKAKEWFLVGYSVNSKAFRVFNSQTRKVEENLHVNFLENKPNVAGQGLASENEQALKNVLNKMIDQEKEATNTPVNAASALRTYNDAGSSFIPFGGSFSDDPLMPDLEDNAEVQNTGIFGSAYDDEDLDTYNSPYANQVMGAEANFNNMEPSTVVSPIPSTRVQSIHLKDQIIGDPRSAVQTRGMTKKSSEEHAMISYIHK
ncbi:hypothetical protein Tco_0365365 [Tanacetum coccineum]